MLRYGDSNSSRLIDVLEGRIPDRIPYLDFLFSKQVMEYTLGREVDQRVVLRADQSTKVDVDSRDFIEFLSAIGQDLAGFLILAPDQYRINGREVTKCLDLVPTREQFSGIEYPDFEAFISEYRQRFDSLAQFAPAANIGLTMLTGAVFQDTHQLMGFENCMFSICQDPGYVGSVLDFFTEIYYQIAKFICSNEVSVFFYTDNVAYNRGPFLDPAVFAPMYLPRLEKILQPAKRKGLPIIFDSDGDIEWLLEDLIRLGVKAVHPIDPGGMDIYRIKEKYGRRITIMGNVGQGFPLSTGTCEDVRKDVMRRIAILGNGGRYVLKSSHDVGENVQPANFEMMIQTLHECGYYE
jgi:hypothetical protein